MKNVTFLMLTLIIINSSCKSTSSANVKQALTPNQYVEILSGSHSNFEKKSFITIESIEKLDSIYATLNKTRTPKYKTPKVNFDKEIVVGLFMGTKSSGGYAIKIDHIQSDGNYTAVFINETKPTGMATSVITQPFYLARINKPTKPIRFISFK